MSNIHEMFGVLSEQHANLQAEYQKLLRLVGHLKSGRVKLEQVTINEAGGGSWAIKVEADENEAGDPVEDRITGDS